ncbi:MAG: hypothetical protein GDA42_06020 [Ekhidna sp.]|nr:hypothetical protein [Ekhidna sp.]MBC6410001.1 hypothetical protein [Ekhidna sp.]
MKKFFVRLTQWEYWPFSLLYFPVFFYYFLLSLKKRSFFFFTSSNPKIEFGGMFGERKSDIFKLIPTEFIPETHLIAKGDLKTAKAKSEEVGFPLIAKPNIGERGAWVRKIDSNEELAAYVETCPVAFLLQELIKYPVELGIFYLRYPHQGKGIATSIVRKNFLKVIGDGRHSINELLNEDTRALLTVNPESEYLKKIGSSIPKKGEEVLIEPIGNHCRGTQFLNDNEQIDKELNEAIDKLAKQISGFYFGRFDLRCKSYEELKQLKAFKILELNGAGSEPGHIYQPGYSLFKAYKDILWHLKALADISEQNKMSGVSYWTFKKGIKKWRAHQAYKRLLNA